MGKFVVVSIIVIVAGMANIIIYGPLLLDPDLSITLAELLFGIFAQVG